MRTYTSCRRCGDLLHTTDGDTVHPLCEAKPTKAERLAAEWVVAVENNDTAREAELQAQIDELDNQPPKMLAAALKYASWGWPVFPLRPHSKIPATRHGFKDATTNPDRIQAWWTRHPDHNIGLPTGVAFDVIDIDPPAGATSYHQLLQGVDPKTGRGVLPDSHGQVATASGGLHLYVLPSGDGNRAGVMAGIDYRGAGGYVVGPPSWLGQRGRRWSWMVMPSPAITGPQRHKAVA